MSKYDDLMKNIEVDNKTEGDFDDLLVYLFQEDEKKTKVVNPKQCQLVIEAYKVLAKMLANTKAQVSYKLFEPAKTMGYIEVLCSKIVLRDVKTFVALSKLASNIEVYPRTDNKVQINIAFHRVAENIE